MAKSAILVLLIFLVVALLPMATVKPEAATLASTIAAVANGNSWSGTPETISIGMIFGKSNVSDFDALSIPDGSCGWAWARQVASVDGYTSPTLDGKVQNMMSNMAMTGYLPQTDPIADVWLANDRYVIPCYDLASRWGLSSQWDKDFAVYELYKCFMQTGQKPLLGFNDAVGWYYAERYYDEWAQDLDIFLKMGDLEDAAALWAGVNSQNWNGSAYVYRPNWKDLECEVGFFAAIIANYEATVGGTLPYFDRVSADLYTKLLQSGWNSPLWKAPSVMLHSSSQNPQARLQNTLGGIEALQMYYKVCSSAWQSAFVSLLTGNVPAWQYLMSSVFYNSSNGQFRWTDSVNSTDSQSTAMGAALLFLYGIIPNTGSLAIPCNEWKYEDFATMLPSTLFRFDYDTQRIRIPVWAGTLKFIFGTSTSSCDFPHDGVYDVKFSSDWNKVTAATFVSSLDSQFHYINQSSTPSLTVFNGTCSKEIVGQGYPVGVTVTIANYDDSAETTQVSVYANQTSIFDGTVSLANKSIAAYTLTCNTTGLTEGNYTIRIHSRPVPGINDTADITFNIGWIVVTVPGDVDGNFRVQLADLAALTQAYGSQPGDPNWNPNADIDGNGVVGLHDLYILAQNYG